MSPRGPCLGILHFLPLIPGEISELFSFLFLLFSFLASQAPRPLVEHSFGRCGVFVVQCDKKKCLTQCGILGCLYVDL